jgi:hypothetical protein
MSMLLFARQQLRESSEELKILEARLRAAYVSKELAAQIAEKRAAAAMKKVGIRLNVVIPVVNR